MFLEAISIRPVPCSIPSPPILGGVSNVSNNNLSLNSVSSFPSIVIAKKRDNNGLVTSVSNQDVSEVFTGMVFTPFEEVKKDEFVVSKTSEASLARQRFGVECEAAINDQINVEYSVSYVYHSLYAYFDRDNVALKGLAKFFKDSSLEEREHAEKLMEYQNKRGGRVQLYRLDNMPADFDDVEKGDALNAMELALSLEKLVNGKLLQLHRIADESNDPQLADFIESEFLAEQVEAIKKISEYVAQLRRVGKGHGVWHFDQMLIREANGA